MGADRLTGSGVERLRVARVDALDDAPDVAHALAQGREDLLLALVSMRDVLLDLRDAFGDVGAVGGVDRGGATARRLDLAPPL